MPGKYSSPIRRGPRAGVRRSFLVAVLGLASATAAIVPALASCARKPATIVEKASPGEQKPLFAPSSANAATEAQRTAAPQAVRPAGPPAAPLAASMRAYGLRVGGGPRIASDFSLGPLQSYRPAEGDEAAVFAIARAFVEGLAAGKLDKALLLPEARDALFALLAPPAPVPGSQASIPYRLGAIALQGRDASLRIRLAGARDAAREEGLLSLRKAGDAWYVEALALDQPASGALAFDPDSSARPR